MANEFKIATQAAGVAGLTLLTELVAPVLCPVQATYEPYTEYDALGDGSYRGQGAPTAEWRLPVLTLSERNQMRSFCPGASARVYIRTINDSGAYANYLAVMVWPKENPRIKANMLFDLTVRFEMLELQETA